MSKPQSIMSDINEKNVDPSLLDLESNYSEQSTADTERLSSEPPHADNARKIDAKLPTGEEISTFALIALLITIYLAFSVGASRERRCAFWYAWALRTFYEAFVVVIVSHHVRGWTNNSGIRAWILTIVAISLSVSDEFHALHWPC